MQRTVTSPKKYFSDSFRVLTNDPSFTAWGWAVLDNREQILASGCIRTSPEQKKRRIRASDDRTRRIVEIVQQLQAIIDKYKITYVLSEAPHGSQNANAAIMIGIVFGITTTISECRAIPIEYYSEQDAKMALLHKKAASKEEVIEAISDKYDIKLSKYKYENEAVADALAVHYVASKQSPIVKMMTK